jgi:hypothetical protein
MGHESAAEVGLVVVVEVVAVQKLILVAQDTACFVCVRSTRELKWVGNRHNNCGVIMITLCWLNTVY